MELNFSTAKELQDMSITAFITAAEEKLNSVPKKSWFWGSSTYRQQGTTYNKKVPRPSYLLTLEICFWGKP